MRLDYKKIIFLVILSALVGRFLFSFNADSGPSRIEDDREYYELGRSLVFDGVLSEPFIAWEPSAHRGFLYPVYLSLFAGRSSDGWSRALAGVLAASLALAALLAAASLEAGLGVLPPLFFVFAAGRNFDSSLYIEQFYSLCVLLCAVLAARWARSPGVRESVMLGLSLAFSLACRSTLIFLPPVLALWGLARLKGLAGRSVVLLLLCAYLPLAAWTVRNAGYFGRFVPLEDKAAAGVLYTASVGLDYGLTIDEISERFFAERPDLRGRGWAEVSGAMTAAALKNIAVRPASYLYGVLRRAALGTKMALGQSGWLVLPALLAGLWFARGEKDFQIFGVFVLYFIVVHSFLSVSARYFTPIAPVLCLTAAYGGRGFAGSGVPARSAGVVATAVFSGLALLWFWGNAALFREARAMRGVVRGLHKRAVSLMDPAGGCEAAALLAGALARPPANPPTLSKLYSDSAVAAYFCSKDRMEVVRFSKKALFTDPENFGAKMMLKYPGR